MGCSHKSIIMTVTAGLAREVCEACGHVSLRFVEEVVQLRPAAEKGDESVVESTPKSFEATIILGETSRYRRCLHCAQPAVFMVPEGMTCDEHAWQAAARLDWDATDPWVPIRIDRSNRGVG